MPLRIVSGAQARATLVTQNDYSIEWTPARDYVAGVEAEVRLGSLRQLADWRFVAWECDKGDVIYRWKERFAVSEMWTNPHYVLVRFRFQHGVRKARPVRITTRAIPSHWAGINAKLSVWIIDRIGRRGVVSDEAEAVREPGSSCEIETVSGPVERFRLYCRPCQAQDGTVRMLLAPSDRFGNPAIFAGPLPVTVRWGGEERAVEVAGATVVEMPAVEDRAVSRAVALIPIERLAPEETIANGEREGRSYRVVGNPVWSREACGGLIPSFGEFHWHTEFSGDGERPIREALRAARDLCLLDFAAPADHNPNGEQWRDTVSAVEEFDEAGRFATFFGWEAGSDRGHENIYFTDPAHPMVCGGEAGYTGARPADFPDELDRIPGYLRVPHHTNSVAESRHIETDVPYWHEYPWNAPSDSIRLAEIMQARGNQERNVYTDAWRGWHQNHGASLQDALTQGYRIGFTGGTDNHCGWPGRAFALCEGDAYTHPPYTEILTGLWTSEVSRNGVFDALTRRATWAVCNTRAILRFEINGVAAGGELEAAEGTEINATVRVSAEDSIATIEIVSDGRVVWRDSSVDPDYETSIPLGTLDGSTYFYLRGRERGGGIFYASPVFLDATAVKR